MAKKMRDVWQVWDIPVVGSIYRDVFSTGKLYKCIEVKPVENTPFCDYVMEEVKTGKQGIYQEEGWKFVKISDV